MAGSDAILWPDASGTWNVQAVASAAAFAGNLRTVFAALPAGGGKVIILPSTFTSNGNANCYEWDGTACALTKQNVEIEAFGVRVRFANTTDATGIDFNRPNCGIRGLTCIEDTSGAPANRRQLSFRQVSAVRCDDGYVDRCRYLYTTTAAYTNGGNAFVGVDGHEAADMCRGFRMSNCTALIGTGASTVGSQVNQWYSGGIYPTHASMLIASHVQGLKFHDNNLLYGTNTLLANNYFGAFGIFEECPYSQYSNNTSRGANLQGISTGGSLFIVRKFGPSGWNAGGAGGFEGHHDTWSGNRFEDNDVVDCLRIENAHYGTYMGNMFGRGQATGAQLNFVDGTTYSVSAGGDGISILGNDFHNNDLGYSINVDRVKGVNIGSNNWELIQDELVHPSQALLRVGSDCRQLRFRGDQQSISWGGLKAKPRLLWDIAAEAYHTDSANPSNDAVRY